MSYGEQLASAAAGLARAHAALRDPPPGPAARASAALSRVRLYRSLEQQIVALGNVHTGALPPVGEPPQPLQRPVPDRSPVTTLAVALRQSAASTTAANWISRVDPPAAGPAAIALRDAYQALQTAGDILISNAGPHIGLKVRHRPLTTEGMALLAGAGRSDNLAALARLAAAAAAMDVRLARWMWPEDAPTDLKPLLAAAEQDAWQTKSGPLREAALLVAAGGDAQYAPVLEIAAAPPVNDPLHWSHPDSGRDCVEAIDAARVWVTRHGTELTVGQLAATARAALAITHYVGHIHMHLAPAGSTVSTELVAAAVRPWRGVLQAVTELRSPVPAHADHSTLTVAVGSAAAWLRSQLRPDGQWLGPASWGRDAADRAAWRETAGHITARMPDLADLLHQAIGTVHAHGGVLAATGRLSPWAGRLVRAPEWTPAPAEHRSYRALGQALSAAAAHGRGLAAAVGVRPRLGLEDARTARRQASAPPPGPARLAGQWYPQPDGMAEPTVPSATAVARSSGQQRPDRGLAR
jgi:hypothetical protein